MSADDNHHRPMPNSYWIIPGRFAAGEYPGVKAPIEAASKLRAQQGAGIDHFIDLTGPDELVPHAEIAGKEARSFGVDVGYERHPVVDLSVPQRPEHLVRILDAIDSALDDDRTVYMHCWAGVGRTGAAVGCWLIRHGRTGEESLAQVAEWWRGWRRCTAAPCPRKRLNSRSMYADGLSRSRREYHE